MKDKHRLRRLFDNSLLKPENNISHNLNDQKMIEWASGHVSTNYFISEQLSFGCYCEYEHEEKEWELDEDGNEKWEEFQGSGEVYYLTPIDPDWEEWMNDYETEKIAFYYCPDCENWAMDDDW